MDTDRLITSFTAHWRLLGHSPHSLDCYLGVLRRLPKLDCDATDVQQYLGERAEKISAATTLAVDVRALRSFYGWRAETLDCDNPAASSGRPRSTRPRSESSPMRTTSRC